MSIGWSDVTDTYDAISCVDVLEHLHPDFVDTALRTISDVLAPGGWLVMHYANDRHEGFPQHIDHDERIKAWLESDFEQLGEFLFKKRSELSADPAKSGAA
jgi:cyclopropane fatty-acyl-phospholipid synthase-like methyltransferase